MMKRICETVLKLKNTVNIINSTYNNIRSPEKNYQILKIIICGIWEHILLFAFVKTYQTPCYYILLPVIEKFLERLKILGTSHVVLHTGVW